MAAASPQAVFVLPETCLPLVRDLLPAERVVGSRADVPLNKGCIDYNTAKAGAHQMALSAGNELMGLPLGRLATPEDIGRAVAFLVSDQAAYVCGVVLTVDGGAFIQGPAWAAPARHGDE